MGNTVIGKFLQGLMGPRVAVTISYPDPYEPPLLDPPEALPTSEPETAQIEIAITQDMLPIWSPFELPHRLVGILYVGGRNPTGGQLTVYYRVLLNGVTQSTGSNSVFANYYYTYSHFQFPNVVVGDVVACKLWASGAGLTWDYRGLATLPSRVLPLGRLLRQVSLTHASSVVLAGGTPSVAATNSAFVYQGNDLSFTRALSATTVELSSLLVGTTVPGYMPQYGDMTVISIYATSSSSRPCYTSQYRLTSLSFRPLNLRL